MEVALIVGAGSGLSASLARLLAKEGFRVAIAARDAHKLISLKDEVDGLALACDATVPSQVEASFREVEQKWSAPDLAVYNASFRTRGPITELDANDVQKALAVCAMGGFHVGQAAARRMV